MPKRKGQLEIGTRAIDEMRKKYPNLSDSEICNRIGMNRKTAWGWTRGDTPSGFALQKLCYAGCDVKYILTGIRSIERS